MKKLMLIMLVLMLPAFGIITPSTPAVAQTITGPKFTIVQQKPDFEYAGITYCHDYFSRTPPTQWVKDTYLGFSYHGGTGGDQAPLRDISITYSNVVGGTPKAEQVGDDHGQTVWKLIMTESFYKDNIECLQGIRVVPGS